MSCELCNNIPNCSWTLVRGIYECRVASQGISNIKQCPLNCNNHKSCSTCLKETTTDDGWSRCHWSNSLQLCFSPTYENIYCTGGVCGLILKQKDQCPNSCIDHTDCQTCLRYSHCGWCSKKKKGSHNDGICTEGSLFENPENTVCSKLYSKVYNTSINEPFTWNYQKCPCGDGYMSDDNNFCNPICEKGCVYGKCVKPNECKCDFGYVGSTCSIECNCNGNAECAGPDKLDECGPCHNNTMGKNCESCQKWFVKTSKNSECISCKKFCNNHTEICVPSNFTFNEQDITKDTLDDIFTEGITGDAVCLNCQNFTAGKKCETCLQGYFRENSRYVEACRPCEW